ncbi:MAG: iron-sulfur cluster assembly scaffold protein [Gemmatimonadaceae bacterium]|nr:iron-sulfur cluster assembly scaffold protein [Gemmatimonadaceae bacterium]
MSHPYSARILEHFRRPRNQGTLEHASVSQEGSNPLCGDRVRVELAVEGDVVRAAKFVANACAVCVASASVLTGLVHDAPLEDVESLTTDELVRALDARLPAARLACVSLPLTVLHAGVMLYRQRTREAAP